MRKDETGNRYGRLTVISFAGVSHDRKAMWECQCDCGKKTIVRGKDLRNGRTTSCGCLVIENLTVKKIAKTHGLCDCRLHRIWTNIKTRCYNQNSPDYKYYGGRGIKMCNEWKEDFKAFYDWAMENGYSEDLTVDRIDTFGDYEPINCRWITIQEQQKNRRSCLIYKD
jgi:hypothetical protein